MCRYKDYWQVERIAEKYYQDHNMCTLVALIASTGCSYGKAFSIFNKLGRQKRKGTYRHQQRRALAELGYKLTEVPRYAKTLTKIEELVPKTGTYWVYSRRHVTCVVDGKVFDVPLKGSRRRVQSIYKVETV